MQNGLQIKANENKYLVHKNTLIKKEAEKIKKIYEQLPKCERIELNELPSDKTIVYIYNSIKNFIGKDYNCNDFNIALIMTGWFEWFKKTPEKEIEEILNSKYIKTLSLLNIHSSIKEIFCGNIGNINNSQLDIIEKELHSKIFQSCFIQYYSKGNNYTNVLSSDSLECFKKAMTPVIEFSKKENAKLFEDSISKRNIEDIFQIIEILNKRIDKINDKDLNQFCKVANELISAKNPEGNFLFGYSSASDSGSKIMLNGLEKILDAMQGNTEEFEKLMELLNLSKEGKIPPFVLGNIAKKGSFSPDFIKKVNRRINNLPIISKYNTLDEAKLKKHKEGDILQIGQTLFCKSQNRLLKLDIDNETFDKLFPEIESIALSQGENGDCYLISAIYDFMKNPSIRAKIYQMFQKKR